jgi:hypothetical protein
MMDASKRAIMICTHPLGEGDRRNQNTLVLNRVLN